MGYKHQQSDLLAAAVELVLDGGLAQLTFARIAARLGIADRTVVYYFRSKEELVAAVLAELGGLLMGVLADAFGTEPLPADELLRRAWPSLTTPQADAVFRVLFEMTGQAAARVEPYHTMAPALMEGWADWLAPHIACPAVDNPAAGKPAGNPAADNRAEALGVMARVDGLLLLRHTAGPELADRAAAALGAA